LSSTERIRFSTVTLEDRKKSLTPMSKANARNENMRSESNKEIMTLVN